MEYMHRVKIHTYNWHLGKFIHNICCVSHPYTYTCLCMYAYIVSIMYVVDICISISKPATGYWLCKEISEKILVKDVTTKLIIWIKYINIIDIHCMLTAFLHFCQAFKKNSKIYMYSIFIHLRVNTWHHYSWYWHTCYIYVKDNFKRALYW